MAVMRYREALNQALREEMERDEAVLLMGEDIGVFQGAFKVTAGLLEQFGERRVRDTPISENTIVGMGVGASMTGLRPVVELMTINFSLLALDQIVNHAAHIHYMFGGQARVPLVVRMPQGAGHQLGPTHSHCLEAMYLQVPGLLVAVPATAADAKGLLKSAIRSDDPVLFCESQGLYARARRGARRPGPARAHRRGARSRREGADATIVAWAPAVFDALERRPRRWPARTGRVRRHRPAYPGAAGHGDRFWRRCARPTAASWPRRPSSSAATSTRTWPRVVGAGLRRPRRAGGARHRRRPADALLQAAGADRLSARATGGRRRAGHFP